MSAPFKVPKKANKEVKAKPVVRGINRSLTRPSTSQEVASRSLRDFRASGAAVRRASTSAENYTLASVFYEDDAAQKFEGDMRSSLRDDHMRYLTSLPNAHGAVHGASRNSKAAPLPAPAEDITPTTKAEYSSFLANQEQLLRGRPVSPVNTSMAGSFRQLPVRHLAWNSASGGVAEFNPFPMKPPKEKTIGDSSLHQIGYAPGFAAVILAQEKEELAAKSALQPIEIYAPRPAPKASRKASRPSNGGSIELCGGGIAAPPPVGNVNNARQNEEKREQTVGSRSLSPTRAAKSKKGLNRPGSAATLAAAAAKREMDLKKEEQQKIIERAAALAKEQQDMDKERERQEKLMDRAANKEEKERERLERTSATTSAPPGDRQSVGAMTRPPSGKATRPQTPYHTRAITKGIVDTGGRKKLARPQTASASKTVAARIPRPQTGYHGQSRSSSVTATSTEDGGLGLQDLRAATQKPYNRSKSAGVRRSVTEYYGFSTVPRPASRNSRKGSYNSEEDGFSSLKMFQDEIYNAHALKAPKVKKPTDIIYRLPRDVLLHVHRYLDVVCTVRCARVNKWWWSALAEPASWKQVSFKNVTEVFNDFGMNRLSRKWSLLERLDLSSCGLLTAPSFVTLAQACPNLINLNLSKTQIDDDCIREICMMCARLRTIDLSFCEKGTDEGVKWVANSYGNQLVLLNLTRCKMLTDRSLHFIGAACGGLRELNLTWCRSITDQGLESLAKCQLQTLNLRYCTKLTDKGIEALCKGSALQARLETLSLDHCSAITDKSVFCITSSLVALAWLSLLYCKLVTDKSLDHFQNAKCTNLKRLNLDYCDGISVESLRHLLTYKDPSGCNGAQTLDMSGDWVDQPDQPEDPGGCPFALTLLSSKTCPHFQERAAHCNIQAECAKDTISRHERQ